MIAKHYKSPQCSQCGQPLTIRINKDKHVEYYCEKCGNIEVDDRSLDVDLRYMPTFHTKPIIKI